MKNNIFNLNNRIKYRNKNNINNIPNINNDNDNENNSYTLSQLNKTIELNNAYNELYNSIDEKTDNDLSKFFGNYSPDLTDTQEKTKSHNLNDIQNRNITPKKIKSITPSQSPDSYNTFDILYYESERIGEKNKIKQEKRFKLNHPFKPEILPVSKKINKNRNKSTDDFLKRINKNLEEIKIINKSNNLNKEKINNKKINRRILIQKNSKKNLREEKSPNKKNVKNKFKGYNEKRINIEKKDLEIIKNEEDIQQKNIYNINNQNIIMKLKYKKYKELFDLLDSNKDGFISSSKIQLTKIDQNILKNISPILKELNETNKQMDFNEFCYKAEQLVNEQN